MKLFYTLVLPLVSARAIETQQVLVSVAGREDAVQSTTYEQNTPPAIGVHFTTSYAVAAARFPDGTTRDLARVAGDAEYIELMSRWSDGSSSVGLDQDAATFADLMRRTRSAMEAELGMQVTRIAPTFPLLPSYDIEAIQQALSAAGLASTRDHSASKNIVYTETDAADIALSQTLRRPLKDSLSQRRTALAQKALYINFDNSSFSIGAMTLQTATQERKMIRFDVNTQLGWWNMPVYDIPRAKFWSQIHEMLLNVLEPLPHPPNRIVLMGDHGADEELKEVVTDAMIELYEFDAELMLSAVKKEDTGILAARGAAELAWQDNIRQREREARSREEEAIEL